MIDHNARVAHPPSGAPVPGYMPMSNYTLNETIIAVAATVWGLWAVYLGTIRPWSNIRAFFILAILIPGVVLLVTHLPFLHKWLAARNWGRFPASIALRMGVHVFLSWSFSLVGVAVCLSDVTPHIHCVPYFALALICTGKVFRLAYYDH